MERAVINAGDKFGRLTIKNELEKHVTSGGNKQRKFLCLCDCGNESVVLMAAFLSGRTQSCGCLHKETVSRNAKLYNTKHGMRSNRSYETWRSMKRRCANEKDIKKFARYGGRGITVCERWVDSFKNFVEDMGERPINMSLDRIDNDGNYEPNNCKWATAKEQASNRGGRFKKYKGEVSLMPFPSIERLMDE